MFLRSTPLLFFSFFILSYSLGAAEYLKSNYYVKSDTIMLSDIIPQPKRDFKIYEMAYTKNVKRVKEQELLDLLKEHGYSGYDAKHSYIQFTKKSPIDMQKIEKELIAHYKRHYKSIDIKSLTLEPRAYLEELPKTYEFGISKRSHLSNRGYCYIYTLDKKKIFFDYTLHATLSIYFSRGAIQKGAKLSSLNTHKKSIMLQRLRAMPIEEIKSNSLEAKHNIQSQTILTSRDVTALYLVRRGATVTVSLTNSGIDISFSAKALSSGRDGDIITVVNSNDKKIKVRVVGPNRAEM